MNPRFRSASRLLALAALSATAAAQIQLKYTIETGLGFASRIAVARHASINGDNIPEVLVGLPDIGAVLIANGRSGAELSRINLPGSNAGFAIASVPSLDNDPNDEILVGDPGSDSVSLWSPRSNNTNVLLATWTPLGFPAGNTGYGISVAAKDLNGDGRAELLIGAPGANRVEIVSIAPGTMTPTLVTTINGLPGEYFGMCVNTFGDQNNDGVDEIAVGSPRAFGMTIPAAPGTVRVFSGALLVPNVYVTSALVTLNGTTNNDQFGWTLTGIGDQNGDGREELGIGTPSDIAQLNSHDDIIAFTLAGNGNLQPQVLYTITGTVSEAVGKGLAPAEDYNGDGVDDFHVGVQGNTAYPNFLYYHGHVDIVPTPRSLWLPNTTAGPIASPYFGETVCSLGTIGSRRVAAVSDRGTGRVYVF